VASWTDGSRAQDARQFGALRRAAVRDAFDSQRYLAPPEASSGTESHLGTLGGLSRGHEQRLAARQDVLRRGTAPFMAGRWTNRLRRALR
jgi:hypothetical protein